MLIVEAGAALTTVLTVVAAASGRAVSFGLQVSIWLWFTVLFATFAEALAEAQGSARAEALRRSRKDLVACRLSDDGRTEQVSAAALKKGDLIIVAGGEA
ncbi:MAG: potassium-transporting ATPase subunit B, partial [Bryobacteraceae bacterium]